MPAARGLRPASQPGPVRLERPRPPPDGSLEPQGVVLAHGADAFESGCQRVDLFRRAIYAREQLADLCQDIPAPLAADLLPDDSAYRSRRGARFAPTDEILIVILNRILALLFYLFASGQPPQFLFPTHIPTLRM